MKSLLKLLLLCITFSIVVVIVVVDGKVDIYDFKKAQAGSTENAKKGATGKDLHPELADGEGSLECVVKGLCDTEEFLRDGLISVDSLLEIARTKEQGSLEASFFAGNIMDYVVRPMYVNEKYDLATEYMKVAFEMAPEDRRVNNNMRSMIQELGILYQVEANNAAYELATFLLDSRWGHATDIIILTKIARTVDRERDAIEVIKRNMDRISFESEIDEADIHFSLGQLYNSLGEYDVAFKRFRKGNNFIKNDFIDKQDIDGLRMQYAEMETIFDKDAFESFNRSNVVTNPPLTMLFVVGFPRSGTSLLERMLTMSNRIATAGESDLLLKADRFLRRKAHQNNLPLVEMMKYFTTENFNDVMKTLIGSVQIPQKKDFLLINNNHVNQAAYSIPLLFKKAKIIWIDRNPLDCLVSNYFVNYKEKSFNAFAFDQKDIAVNIHMYKRLMDHWMEHLPAEQLKIDYEDVVNNPEKVMRELSQFIGVDFTRKMLRFHDFTESRASNISTNSVFDANRPLHNSSINRWTKYESHLTPSINYFKEAFANTAEADNTEL